MNRLKLILWLTTAVLIGLLVAPSRVLTQTASVVFGSSSGAAQAIKSTSNALWVSVQGGTTAISGTPSANQVTTWANASTVQGSANFTWDGSNLAVASSTITLDNNKFLKLKDSSNSAQFVFGVDSANTLKVGSASFTTFFPVGSTLPVVWYDNANAAEQDFKFTNVTVNSSAGATLTATGAIPAGCFLTGVSSRIYTAFGATGGLTSLQIGISGALNAFSSATSAITLNSTTNNASWGDATQAKLYPAATNILITANGGTFDATGQMKIVTHCSVSVAPSL